MRTLVGAADEPERAPYPFVVHTAGATSSATWTAVNLGGAIPQTYPTATYPTTWVWVRPQR